MRLENTVAVVTGAASGIGRAIALRFAAEGARVVAGDWNGARLEEAAAEIRAAGGTVVALQGDIADRTAAEALVDLATSTYGRLDVLCNNAGIMDYMQGVGELDDDVWRRVLRINVDGPMYTSRRAVQVMRDLGGGSIVNIASIGALEGGVAGAAYTVSKHALLGLTRNTAWMYAKAGIRCNAICPGAVATNITESMPPDRLDPAGLERTAGFQALIPQVLAPDDIAAVALFLASDEAKQVNGAVIVADAGWTSV
jgi:NAD(P)-dependent dehydrogenase (short-subunit alcohol dehydrogenase family)